MQLASQFLTVITPTSNMAVIDSQFIRVSYKLRYWRLFSINIGLAQNSLRVHMESEMGRNKVVRNNANIDRSTRMTMTQEVVVLIHRSEGCDMKAE